MINQEQFEFHKSIIDWLHGHGVPFMEAISIVSWAHIFDVSIPESYIQINTKRPEEEEI